MRRVMGLVTGLGLVASAACGGPSPEQQQAAEAARTLQDSAQQMATGAEAFAQGLAQMAQAATDGKVTVVQFEDLQKALPELAGWTRATPTGSTVTMPFAMSQAEADYVNGDQRMEASIVDTALNQALFMPFSMFLASGYSERTSEGFRRSVTIKGEPGFEEWNEPGQSGTVTIVVGKRFVVSVDGSGVSGVEPMRALIERVDFGALTAAK